MRDQQQPKSLLRCSLPAVLKQPIFACPCDPTEQASSSCTKSPERKPTPRVHAYPRYESVTPQEAGKRKWSDSIILSQDTQVRLLSGCYVCVALAHRQVIKGAYDNVYFPDDFMRFVNPQWGSRQPSWAGLRRTMVRGSQCEHCRNRAEGCCKSTWKSSQRHVETRGRGSCPEHPLRIL